MSSLGWTQDFKLPSLETYKQEKPHSYDRIFPLLLEKEGLSTSLKDRARYWKFPNNILPVTNDTKNIIDGYAWNGLTSDIVEYDILVFKTAGCDKINLPFVIYSKGNKLTLIDGINNLSNYNWVQESISSLQESINLLTPLNEMTEYVNIPDDIKSAKDGLAETLSYLKNLKKFPIRKKSITISEEYKKSLLKLWSLIEVSTRKDELPPIEDLEKLIEHSSKKFPDTIKNDEFLIKLYYFSTLLFNKDKRSVNYFTFYVYGFENKIVGRSMQSSNGLPSLLEECLVNVRRYILMHESASKKELEKWEKESIRYFINADSIMENFNK